MVRKHRGKAEILKFYPKKWNEIIVHNLHKNKLDVCKYRILRDLSRELEGKTLLQHMFHAKNIYIIKSEKKMRIYITCESKLQIESVQFIYIVSVSLPIHCHYVKW